MSRGQFIVFEGVDGAGTSTQTALMGQALQRQGIPVHVTREPSNGPIGVLIRQFLTRRLVVPGRTGPRPPRMETMALLFAADRVDHLESEVLPNLADRISVICDRYLHSSLAYQSMTAPEGEESARQWVAQINDRTQAPDLVIVLDVPPDVAAERRAWRGGPEEMYEDTRLQERLAGYYASLPEHYPETEIVVIDGARDPAQVHADCLTLVLARLQA